MREVLLLCAVIIGAPHGKAAEIVIDWESGARCAPKGIHGGLRFTNARGSLCIDAIPGVSNGTQACFDASGLLAEHLHGAPFSLLSAELPRTVKASCTSGSSPYITS